MALPVTADNSQQAGPPSALILHGIGTPRRPLEPGEDVFWLSEARFRNVLDAVVAMGRAAPRITFDDGNASDIDIAAPELEARGLKATFFLLTGRLDQEGSLSAADVSRLARAGHKIGLHGHGHVDWRKLDRGARHREFVAARETLASLAGAPVNEAAAPFGLYDRNTVRDLKALGFKALHTSDRGLAHSEAFIRPRNCLEGAMSDSTLHDALRGRMGPLRRARRLFGIARKRLLPVRVRS